jgi:hypothetical protein
MSADHVYIRRGGNKMVGMKNEDPVWEINSLGFNMVHPQYNPTFTLSVGTDNHPLTFEFNQIGSTAYITWNQVLWTHVGATNPLLIGGTLDPEWRPRISQSIPVAVVGYVQYPGILHISSNGTLQLVRPSSGIMIPVSVATGNVCGIRVGSGMYSLS